VAKLGCFSSTYRLVAQPGTDRDRYSEQNLSTSTTYFKYARNMNAILPYLLPTNKGYCINVLCVIALLLPLLLRAPLLVNWG
jgi:hypothetical protein